MATIERLGGYEALDGGGARRVLLKLHLLCTYGADF